MVSHPRWPGAADSVYLHRSPAHPRLSLCSHLCCCPVPDHGDGEFLFGASQRRVGQCQALLLVGGVHPPVFDIRRHHFVGI